MPLHDVAYQHWVGVHHGLWRRRLAIALHGIKGCLQVKGMRHALGLAWISALVMTALLFMVGQLLVADSIVVQWAGNLNPQLQTLTRLLTTWLETHPEISVRTTQNGLFLVYGIYLMRLAIFVLGMAMPFLVTRDLGSNAIIIYASKAVSRGDYLLGKFMTVAGLVGLIWLGPVCAAWLAGNLLAPDWRFFWHSRAALGHMLTYGFCAMMILGVIALGVSAVSSNEKSTPALWYVWWVIGGVLGPIALNTQPWLRHFSFNFNLDQIALAIFRPADDLVTAQKNLPLLGDLLRNVRPETMAGLSNPPAWGACCGLALMVIGAAIVINKRVRPE